VTQERRRKARADHGRRLQDQLVALGETVEARGEQRLDGRRNRQLVDRLAQLEPAAAPGAAGFERAAVDQRLDDLFDEEGVAAGALANQPPQAGGGPVIAEQAAEQRVGRVVRQRRQRQLAIASSPPRSRDGT
jgi:hypothetical protein